MLKKWFLVGGILLLVSVLMLGCGIPKEDYEAVVAERDSAQAELQSVQSELQSVSSELSAAQATIQAQEQAMAKAKTSAEIINTLFVPILKGEEGPADPVQIIFEWRDQVEATGDAVMKAKFDAFIESEGGEEETTDFFRYLFESIPETLE